MQNICKFIPPNRTADHIQPINFVFETNTDVIHELAPCTVYRLHYVTDGIGEVKCGETVQTVKKGDIFFAFPGIFERISSVKDFKYMYISYIGIRAGYEMERLKINYKSFVFEDLSELNSLWSEGIKTPHELIDLVSESIVLQTLAKIGERTIPEKDNSKQSQLSANFTLIKKYIDDNFADPNLSCESISAHFCYNKKYISTLFKKNFKLGISAYINTVRINNACSLIESGHTNVSEIAASVGFNDALYFSKVFKKKTGSSPKQFATLIQKSENSSKEI